MFIELHMYYPTYAPLVDPSQVYNKKRNKSHTQPHDKNNATYDMKRIYSYV